MAYREEVELIRREAWWTFGRVVRWGILPLIALGVIGSALGWISLPFRTARGVAERTLNPDAVLANYEWFKQTVQEVRALEVQLTNARAALVDFRGENPRPWDYPTSTEAARLGAIVLGIQNQRQNLVAEYNARSQMANRALFKSANLPETLPFATDLETQ